MQVKRHMSKKVSIVLLGVSVLVLAAFSAAHADSISFTTSTPIASTLTDWTSSLTFQQFNPSLGTLTGVAIDLSSTLSTTLTVTNVGTSQSNGSARTEILIAVVDPSGIIGTLPTYTPYPVQPSNPQLDYMSKGFSYSNLASGGQVTSGTLTGSATNVSNSYTTPGLLAEFTGAGSISLPAATLTYTDLSNSGGNTESAQVTYAGLTGTVTYLYTPVPLPSALLLFGPGLLGLVGLRRRYLA